MRPHNPDYLYELLPQHIRARDVEHGYPLRALLQVIAEQVGVVEDNMAQLYDNWFIETCEDWVVPYLGELIGYQPLETIDDPGISRSPARDRILIPRREVANTIRYRARKGTLSVLEALTMDVTGWVAAAVEFFNKAPIDGTYGKKNADRVRRAVGNAFFQAARAELPAGKTAVGLFVWRRHSYPVTRSTPNYVETEQAEYFAFSPLGNHTPLYTRYERREGPADLSYLPIPITREMFTEETKEIYYGDGRSFCIYAAEDWPPPPSDEAEPGELQPPYRWRPIRPEYIIPGDLHALRKDNRPSFPQAKNYQIVVDPELGRFIFPGRPRQRPRHELRVSYWTGFCAAVGGGEYQRPLTRHPDAPDATTLRTPCAGLMRTLEKAIGLLKKAGRKGAAQGEGANHVLLEITDSELYLGWLPGVVLKRGQTLQIRAADHCRPVIWIAERSTSLPDSLRLLAYPGSCFILDGVLLAGRGQLVVEPESQVPVKEQEPARVIIRHSTLVPGWLLKPETRPVKSEGASIELNNVMTRLLIQRSIVGSISVAQEDEPLVDPSAIVIEDSILDSTARQEPALYGEAVQPAYVSLTVCRSTVLGEVEVRELPLAENSIFRDPLKVHNRQGGIVRYCYVPAGSSTPRRFKCADKPDWLTFLSPDYDHYGTADYCRLVDDRDENQKGQPHPILQGGEFGGEMGVYYHLFDPLRIAILRRRLDEYLPVDAQAEIFPVP